MLLWASLSFYQQKITAQSEFRFWKNVVGWYVQKVGQGLGRCHCLLIVGWFLFSEKSLPTYESKVFGRCTWTHLHQAALNNCVLALTFYMITNIANSKPSLSFSFLIGDLLWTRATNSQKSLAWMVFNRCNQLTLNILNVFPNLEQWRGKSWSSWCNSVWLTRWLSGLLWVIPVVFVDFTMFAFLFVSVLFRFALFWFVVSRFAFRTAFHQFSGQWCLFGGLARCRFVWSTILPGVLKCQQELALGQLFVAVRETFRYAVNANISHFLDNSNGLSSGLLLYLILG